MQLQKLVLKTDRRFIGKSNTLSSIVHFPTVLFPPCLWRRCWSIKHYFLLDEYVLTSRLLEKKLIYYVQ